MNKSRVKGDMGEQAACDMLKSKGCTIVARNFSCRYGEIDIIFSDGEYIVFAEVRTRASNALVSPAETVNKSKQKRLIITAQIYLSEKDIMFPSRFDVIEVITNNGGIIEINNIENAFGVN